MAVDTAAATSSQAGSFHVRVAPVLVVAKQRGLRLRRSCSGPAWLHSYNCWPSFQVMLQIICTSLFCNPIFTFILIQKCMSTFHVFMSMKNIIE